MEQRVAGKSSASNQLRAKLNHGRNLSRSTTIRKTAVSLVAQIRHSWDVLGLFCWTRFVAQSIHSVGMGCFVVLGIALVHQPVGKISAVAGPITNTPSIQPSLETSTTTSLRKELPSRGTGNRLTANQSNVDPPSRAGFQSHRFANPNVHCICPTHWADTVIIRIARLITKSVRQFGFCERPEPWWACVVRDGAEQPRPPRILVKRHQVFPVKWISVFENECFSIAKQAIRHDGSCQYHRPDFQHYFLFTF